MWNVPELQAAPSRAPPLQPAVRRPTDSVDHAAVRHRLAVRVGLMVGGAWSITLFSTLWYLGRVPLLEAGLWSLLSGAVLWRTFAPGLRSILDHWLGDASIELGMRDPLTARATVHRAMLRRGYVLGRHRLSAETFRPRRWPGLNPALRIAWSGPGAIVDGPRWLVRIVARIAVG